MAESVNTRVRCTWWSGIAPRSLKRYLPGTGRVTDEQA
jgi:hypothetical protein